MSTLSNILNIAQSGLRTAQTGLETVSNNVANVDTPGYVREVVNQSSLAIGGAGDGVQVDSVTRATNSYLEATNLSAQSDAGRASITSSILDQAQNLFGDPSSTTSFFSQLDNVFSGFSALAASPTASASSAAVSQAANFLSSAKSITSGLQSLSSQSDQQIQSDVSNVNQLLSQISGLNTQISQASMSGEDATGSQKQQRALIGQLSSLVNVTVSTGAYGAVTVRSSNGTLLADAQGSASFSYDTSGPTGQLSVTPAQSGASQPAGAQVTSGELAGLIDLRNTQLPGIASQVAELVGQTAKQLNQASNSYSSFPAPTTLTGANTGLDLPTAIAHFQGQTNVGVVNASGVVQSQLNINFDAQTITAGGTTTSFSPTTFLSSLNSALSPNGSATFSNGALSISATGSNGVVVSDPTADPSAKAGQSFSAYFGLNDLVTSNQVVNADTGLTASDPSGFPAGQSLSFRISAADGSTLKTVDVTTPAGSTVGDLVSALNGPPGGVAPYGAFNLDADGHLAFQPANGSGVSLAVADDDTARGVGGPSVTQLFGIGAAQLVSSVNSYSIRPDIVQSSALLQTSAASLGGVGTVAISPGSTTGADALSQAGQTSLTFNAAGNAPATTATLTGYAGQLAGDLATQSSAADAASTNAQAVANEAQTRLSGAEGVNIDQELVSLTTYQQAYNASARLIQASKDLFDTLLSAVQD